MFFCVFDSTVVFSEYELVGMHLSRCTIAKFFSDFNTHDIVLTYFRILNSAIVFRICSLPTKPNFKCAQFSCLDYGMAIWSFLGKNLG